jgi:hypothetical protein
MTDLSITYIPPLGNSRSSGQVPYDVDTSINTSATLLQPDGTPVRVSMFARALMGYMTHVSFAVSFFGYSLFSPFFFLSFLLLQTTPISILSSRRVSPLHIIGGGVCMRCCSPGDQPPSSLLLMRFVDPKTHDPHRSRPLACSAQSLSYTCAWHP